MALFMKAGSAASGRATHFSNLSIGDWCLQESGRKVAQLEALRLQVNRELDALVKLVES